MKTDERQPIETIIYGGAFNPPTRAHQAILQACVDHAEQTVADVWLLPSGERRDKRIGVDRECRLDLIRAMCADIALRDVTLHIEPQELDQVESTETYDTVQKLQDRFPERHFTWVFGSDSLETVPQWHNGQWLFDNLSMLVVERPGVPLQKLGQYGTRLAVDTIKTSSTEVRRRLHDHESISDLVSPSVLRQLEKV